MKKGGIPEPVEDALVEVMKDRRSWFADPCGGTNNETLRQNI